MAPFLGKWNILPPPACHPPQTILPSPSSPLGKHSKNLWNNRSDLSYLPNLIFYLKHGRPSRQSLPFSSAYGTVASTFKNPFVPMVNVASYCSYPDGNPSGCGMLLEEITDPVNPTAKSVADFTAYVTPLLCK